MAHFSSSVSSQIAVNHKSAQKTAATYQVEQKRTPENTETETEATYCKTQSSFEILLNRLNVI